MANLPGDAWLDADGRHIWWRHRCADGVDRTNMLPWPHWKKNDAEGTVMPSIVCMIPGCNFHSNPLVREPPSDWAPRLTLEELEAATRPVPRPS